MRSTVCVSRDLLSEHFRQPTTLWGNTLVFLQDATGLTNEAFTLKRGKAENLSQYKLFMDAKKFTYYRSRTTRSNRKLRHTVWPCLHGCDRNTANPVSTVSLTLCEENAALRSGSEVKLERPQAWVR